MNPQTKMLRINLMPKEYTLLRDKLYRKQHQCCHICHKWLKYNMFSLHHIISRGAGGDDSEENCYGCCVVGCHPD
jgi:hypothetical protein